MRKQNHKIWTISQVKNIPYYIIVRAGLCYETKIDTDLHEHHT